LAWAVVTVCVGRGTWGGEAMELRPGRSEAGGAVGFAKLGGDRLEDDGGNSSGGVMP
jgi:hypothetical protein